MRRHLAILALSGFLGSLVAVRQAPAHATVAVSVLRATPYEGHAGDVIDLSGAGFQPHIHLYVMMACPNWYAPHVADYGNILMIPGDQGPVTDANGEFAGYLFHALQLHHAVRGESGCEIYTSDGNEPFGPDVPAPYTVLSPSTHVSKPCVVHMCVSVRPSPRAVRAGLVETLALKGWPGAQAQVSVSFPGNKPFFQAGRTLNWSGEASIRFRVTATVGGLTRADVRVRAHLAHSDAQRKSEFVVVHS
jgi:hypothetical protein